MAETPFLSLVIPAFNAIDELAVLLPSVEASEFRDFEVIIVDDGSTDGTPEFLRDHPVRVIETPRNGGPAFARNLGAREARGEIVLFLDSDVVIRPGTLGEVARFFREHPDRSAMIGVYDAEPANLGAWPRYKALQCYSYYWRFPPEKEVTLLWAAVAAFRRRVFLDAGGFDARFRRPSMEDLEFGRRLTRCTPIWLNRRVSVGHHFPATLAKNVRDHFDRGRLWVRIWFRHRSFDNYLSTPRRGLGRIGATVGVLLLLVSPLIPAAAALGAAALGVYLACNWDLWTVVARRRPTFLLHALVIDLLLGLVLGAAAVKAVAEETVCRVKRLAGQRHDFLEPFGPEPEGDLSSAGSQGSSDLP